MTDRPLSHTKRGKILAAVGGLAGGPLGIIASPLVLMIVNANKKDGNRFLVWFALGVPISIGLWFVQFIALFIISAIMIQIDAEGRNGMRDWRNLEEAQELMKSPDWCIHQETWTQDQLDMIDHVKTLTCYKQDNASEHANDYRKIQCKTEPDQSTFECYILPNSQFTDAEATKNKQRFG